MKAWGKREFWGMGSEYDPDWILTESQKKLQTDLIELCRTKIRPHAIHCDQKYVYPRESLEAMAQLGLMGLTIPKEMGGLGENHVCAAMVVETIARYGCPSTAMIYTMHLSSCATLLMRYHNNPHIEDCLKRIVKEKLIGAVSGSDPATGSHDWFPLSCKARQLDEQTVQLLKFGSWCTSAGYADFYSLLGLNPKYDGNYSDLGFYLVYKDEVRASSDSWSALGMHGNMSGPLMVEGKFKTERMLGTRGDGRKIMEEGVDVWFLILTSSCWNGISLGCIDISKKHVTRSAHADVGMRVCDYPVIQDYFGKSVIDTSASRLSVFMMAQTMDAVTNNNDWSLHSDPNYLPRTAKMPWLWQIKYTAAKNVANVTDLMLYACGGTGYKTEIGLERLIRDGKAGWVMAPSNEIISNLVGVSVLTGFSSIDLWEEMTNEKVIHREVKKMTAKQKEALGQRLLEEASQELSGKEAKHPYQDTDFLNPFNTAPPTVQNQDIKTPDGITHKAALNPSTWTTLSLTSRSDLNDKTSSFEFSLPNSTDHTGCLPGQYITVRATINGQEHVRYFSPVSRPDDFGRMELALRFESQGIISNHFGSLKPGDKLDFQGPCGGFEYEANKLSELVILASGGGITPGLQIIRSVTKDPADKTKLTLLYFAETTEELLYRKELDSYAKDERLNIIYSVIEGPEGWEGEEGFIDTQMLNKYVTKPNGKKYKILICGGPTMSTSCLYSLHSLGYPSNSAYIYGQFGVEQIKAVYGKNVPFSGHRCTDVV